MEHSAQPDEDAENESKDYRLPNLFTKLQRRVSLQDNGTVYVYVEAGRPTVIMVRNPDNAVLEVVVNSKRMKIEPFSSARATISSAWSCVGLVQWTALPDDHRRKLQAFVEVEHWDATRHAGLEQPANLSLKKQSELQQSMHTQISRVQTRLITEMQVEKEHEQEELQRLKQQCIELKAERIALKEKTQASAVVSADSIVAQRESHPSVVLTPEQAACAAVAGSKQDPRRVQKCQCIPSLLFMLLGALILSSLETYLLIDRKIVLCWA